MKQKHEVLNKYVDQCALYSFALIDIGGGLDLLNIKFDTSPLSQGFPIVCK